MSGVQNFQSIVSAQTVGTAEIQQLASSFDKLSESIDGATAKGNKLAEHPGFDSFAAKVKQGLQDPLGAVADTAETVLKAMGPMGTAAAAGAGVLGALAVAGFDAAKSLAEYGLQIQNAALRTGLTTKEVGQFAYAAKLTGQDIGVIEAGTRKLSQGLADNTEDGKKAREMLRSLGIQATDVHGNLRPMSDVFIQISAALNGMESTVNRNAAALAIFGRGALEILPTMMGLVENVDRAKKLGLGPEDSDVRRWEEYHRQLVEVETMWAKLKRGFAEPLAAVANIVLHVVTDRSAGREWRIGSDGQLVPVGQNSDGSSSRGSLPGGPFGNGTRQWSESDHIQMLRMQRQMSAGYHPAISDSLLDFADTASERIAVRKNDEAVQAALLGTSQEQLTSAKQKLGELMAGLKQGVLPSVNAGAFQEIATQRGKVTALEAQIKATKGLEEAERSLEAFEKQMREKELNPVERIFARRDDLIARGSNAERATTAALNGALGELAKMEEQDREAAKQISLKQGKLTDQMWSGVYQELEKHTKSNIKDFLDRVAKLRSIAREVDNIQLESERSGFMARSGRATRLAELRLGPGQEAVAADIGHGERLRLADQLCKLDLERAALEQDTDKRRVYEAHAEADLRRETQAADIEHELKLAELERQRLDQLRNRAGELFDGLLQGPKGIEQFLNNLVRGWGRTVFQNFLTDELKNVNTHIFSGMGTAAEPTRLGKLLMGTPFGPDPMKAATELNTAATVTNNQLLAELNSMFLAMRTSLSPSSGGGGIYTSSLAGLRDLNIDPWAGGDLSSLQTSANEAGMTQADPMSTVAAVRARTAQGLWGRAAGVAGVAAGAYGMYAGIEKGGTRGDLEAAGSGVAAVTSILALAGVASKSLGPAGIVAGMGLSFLTGLLGDPKQERAQAEQNTLWGSRYTPPTASNYTMDRYGSSYDTNMAGNLRPIIQVNIPVQALDAKSFSDQAGNLVNTISDALESKISPRLATALRNTVLTR